MKELGAAICCPERLKKVINFFVVGLTYGCLNICGVICNSMDARETYLLIIRRTA